MIVTKQIYVVLEFPKNGILLLKDSSIYLSPKFQPMYETDTEDAPTKGLSLLFYKELVEKLSGKIWVKSIENEGASF